MRKVRNGFIFILTAAILIFCAVLPGVVAKVWDAMADERVEHNEIRTVTFQEDLNMIDKLLLLGYGLSVPISEESAEKTTDQIEQLINAEIEYYQDCGLLLFPTEECEKTIEPVLFFDSSNSESSDSDASCIAWLVELSYGGYERAKLNLWLDDETGKILLISCEAFYEVYDKSTFDECIGAFVTGYLEHLGFFDSAKGYIVEQKEERELFPDKKGGVSCEWSILDPEQGELTLLFYVHSNGFFVSLA